MREVRDVLALITAEPGIDEALVIDSSRRVLVALLVRVSPDFVKVDHEVVRSALMGGAGHALLVAIVAYADAVGAYVIAEGIETSQMLAFVERLPSQATHRIAGVQGFLLGTPERDRSWDHPAVTHWPLTTHDEMGSSTASVVAGEE